MKATWSAVARRELDEFSVALAEAAESEADVMFSDAIPGTAVGSFRSGGLLTIELPCGIEAEFERTGDGVVILHVRG